MPVRITCPHCHHDLRLVEELYDRSAQCPLCKGAFAVSWPARPREPVAAAAVPAPIPEPPALRPCVKCGEIIKQIATRCPHCGQSQSAE